MRGLLFLEDGTVEVLGEIRSFDLILRALSSALRQITEEQKKIKLSTFSNEDLEEELKKRNG